MSAPDLQGRSALVTGAARRTGRALALAIADAGADVAVHYRQSRDEAEAVAEEIRARGRRSTTVRAELGDAAEAQRAVDEAARVLGRLDILINNVGEIVWKDLDDITPEEWRRKRAQPGTFAARIHSRPHLLVLGSDDELRAA